MKFSVLLPTRNRLDLLKLAVETVRRQDYGEWEVIISDNFSDQDVEGYVRSIGDQRIKYYRTDRFVPVTENWNLALEKSSGDYVIMLGDDDGLMRGYFAIARSLIEKFNFPDLLYTKAYLYAYPGVMPGYPDGFLVEAGCGRFFRLSGEPFLLDRREGKKLVRDSMNFRLSFDYNMQYSLVRREFIDSTRAKGSFFQSPYPDYYASNVLFLKAKTILIIPKPLVAIGISPKSFGYFYFNKRERQGTEFLKNLSPQIDIGHLRDVILPGTDMNTSWLLAMETLKLNYGSELDSGVNHRRYRYLQISHAFREYFLGKSVSKDDLRNLLDHMNAWEKLVYASTLTVELALHSLYRKIKRWKIAAKPVAAFERILNVNRKMNERRFNDILEVFDQVDPLDDRPDPPHAAR